MKKITLVLVAIFSLILSPQLFADNENHPKIEKYGYNDDKAFTFVEEGITFSIYQNGEFDFYINPRRGMHVGVDFDEVSISYNSGYDYEPYVQYDDYGAIIQIENTPIYYDYYGRITRAGDIKIRYNSNRVNRIGSLNIYYNNYGHYSYQRGYVNVYNRHHVFHPYHNFFVLPIYTRCIVSYNPYRNSYNPTRYKYYYGKTSHQRNYLKSSYNNTRGYKSIDSRVRTQNSSVARSNDVKSRRNVSTRNNSTVKRSATNRSSTTRNNKVSNRNETSRTAQRGSTSTTRVKQPRSVVRESSVSSPNRRVENTRSTVKNRTERKPVNRSVRTQTERKPVQRSVSTQTRKAPERSATNRSSTTRNNSSAPRAERKPVQRTSSSERSVSSRSSTVRNNSSVQRAERKPIQRASTSERGVSSRSTSVKNNRTTSRNRM